MFSIYRYLTVRIKLRIIFIPSYIQFGGKANKNGVWVENRPIRRVQPLNLLNHKTQANHKLQKQILNPHAIFVRLFSPLDMLISHVSGLNVNPICVRSACCEVCVRKSTHSLGLLKSGSAVRGTTGRDLK